MPLCRFLFAHMMILTRDVFCYTIADAASWRLSGHATIMLILIAWQSPNNALNRHLRHFGIRKQQVVNSYPFHYLI